MKDKPLIFTDYTKTYGSFRGVDNISLELESGEIFGFLGPNGAGKSTAIRTVLNFIKPSTGSISIFGLDSVKDDVAVKHHVGYLAGDIALYEEMTGRQVLQYLAGLGKKIDWDYVDKLTVRLNASLDRRLGDLSKGNKQKIGLIQAFMHKPDLLILDEPTSGLDPLMKQVFYDMTLEMKEQGKTVFVSSHDLTEVQKICDRAAFIREGKLIGIEDIKNASGLKLRRYEITFAKKTSIKPFEKLPGITAIKTNNTFMNVTVSGSVSSFIKELAKHNVVDMNEQETTLEDLFMHYYENDGDAS